MEILEHYIARLIIGMTWEELTATSDDRPLSNYLGSTTPHEIVIEESYTTSGIQRHVNIMPERDPNPRFDIYRIRAYGISIKLDQIDFSTDDTTLTSIRTHCTLISQF